MVEFTVIVVIAVIKTNVNYVKILEIELIIIIKIDYFVTIKLS